MDLNVIPGLSLISAALALESACGWEVGAWMGASWQVGWTRDASDMTNSVWTPCMRELSPSLFPPCERL